MEVEEHDLSIVCMRGCPCHALLHVLKHETLITEYIKMLRFQDEADLVVKWDNLL